MKKYRLVKQTDANNNVCWIIQQKFLFLWEPLTVSIYERTARELLAKLRAGTPYVKKEVVDDGQQQYGQEPDNRSDQSTGQLQQG